MAIYDWPNIATEDEAKGTAKYEEVIGKVKREPGAGIAK